MKVMLAVESCHRDYYMHAHIRATWLSNNPIDYRFFIGDPSIENPEKDEIHLAVPDDYANLYLKTLNIVQWAFNNDYEYLFKTDTDTYVSISRLLTSGFEQQDYSGLQQGEYLCFGGSGYWLSRKAMKIVIDNSNANINHSCEDHWIGTLLFASGIKPFNDYRYTTGPVAGAMIGPQPDNNIITCHRHQSNQQTHLRATPQLYAVHEKAKGI